MMAGIKNKNTKPEIQIRHALHRLGFRYRLHDKSLPGKPDLVLAKYQAIILVNGCFGMVINANSLSGQNQERHFGRKRLLPLLNEIIRT